MSACFTKEGEKQLMSVALASPLHEEKGEHSYSSDSFKDNFEEESMGSAHDLPQSTPVTSKREVEKITQPEAGRLEDGSLSFLNSSVTPTSSIVSSSRYTKSKGDSRHSANSSRTSATSTTVSQNSLKQSPKVEKPAVAAASHSIQSSLSSSSITDSSSFVSKSSASSLLKTPSIAERSGAAAATPIVGDAVAMPFEAASTEKIEHNSENRLMSFNSKRSHTSGNSKSGKSAYQCFSYPQPCTTRDEDAQRPGKMQRMGELSSLQEVPLPTTAEELKKLLDETEVLRNNFFHRQRSYNKTLLSLTQQKHMSLKETAAQQVRRDLQTSQMLQILKLECRDLVRQRNDLKKRVAIQKKLMVYKELVEEIRKDVANLTVEYHDLCFKVRYNEKLLMMNEKTIESGECAHHLREELRAQKAILKRSVDRALRDADEAERQRNSLQQRVKVLEETIASRQKVASMDDLQTLERLRQENAEKSAVIEALEKRLRTAKLLAVTEHKTTDTSREKPASPAFFSSSAQAERTYLLERVAHMREKLEQLSNEPPPQPQPMTNQVQPNEQQPFSDVKQHPRETPTPLELNIDVELSADGSPVASHDRFAVRNEIKCSSADTHPWLDETPLAAASAPINGKSDPRHLSADLSEELTEFGNTPVAPNVKARASLQEQVTPAPQKPQVTPVATWLDSGVLNASSSTGKKSHEAADSGGQNEKSLRELSISQEEIEDDNGAPGDEEVALEESLEDRAKKEAVDEVPSWLEF